jgi:hypothetical protein
MEAQSLEGIGVLIPESRSIFKLGACENRKKGDILHFWQTEDEIELNRLLADKLLRSSHAE